MIETTRLTIIPLTYTQLEKYINAPVLLAKELNLLPPDELPDAAEKDAIVNFLLPNLSNEEKDRLFYTMWIVVLRQENKYVGGICFHGEPNETGEVEIGYGTHTNYQNMGIITEAIAGIISWARNNKKITCIKALTNSENVPSVCVLEKNGFKLTCKADNLQTLKLEL